MGTLIRLHKEQCDEPGEENTRVSGIRQRCAIEPPPAPSPSGRPRSALPTRILLVDDEPEACGILYLALAEHDLAVETSGAKAVQRIACGERFEAILAKVALSGMSGWELYDEIDACSPEQAARVVLVVRRPTDRGTEWFFGASTDAIVRCPSDPFELRALVEAFLPAPTP